MPNIVKIEPKPLSKQEMRDEIIETLRGVMKADGYGTAKVAAAKELVELLGIKDAPEPDGEKPLAVRLNVTGANTLGDKKLAAS